jgi:isopentenyl diphosphate isomerase/L-lactate dehydrogenase-like FMN-dependent dehydrogenase
LAGGRKVNGDIGSFRAFGKITVSERVRRAQEQGKFSILFDSGIWTGSNAIAMGAQGVLRDHGIHLRFLG